jgi:hypothetical protein
MIKENNPEYIDYILKKAFDAFEDAKLLERNQRWNSAINRLYYACFMELLHFFSRTILKFELMKDYGLNLV